MFTVFSSKPLKISVKLLKFSSKPLKTLKLKHLQLENLHVSCMFLIYGDNMILIDYSNNETIEFQTISQAKMFTADLLEVDIKALGIRCEDSSDFNLLEDYILGLTHSIS